MNELELVKEAKYGEQRTFGLLVDRYYHMVYGICFRMTGNAADADELAHDSFVEAYLQLGQLKDPSRFGGWLKTLTLNVCRMWRRRKNRLITVELNENIPAVENDDDEQYAGMYFGMSRLSKAHRLVLTLHYFEGLSYVEIAKFLDIPNGTVMSRLSRARNLLKEELENMTEDNDMQDIPDVRFKEEVQAEVSLLLSIKNCKTGTGMRLRGIFEKSPERLIRLLQESDDTTVLHNIAVVMPRLGNGAMHGILTASLSSDSDLSERAKIVLREYIARCEHVTFPGSETSMASMDAYILIDQLKEIAVSDASKAQILFQCVDFGKDSSIRALLINALLRYREEAFQLLMESFSSDKDGGSRWVRHALARTGNRFLAELHRLITSESEPDKRLALLGLETIARSMEYPWIDECSPVRFANELRVTDKYPPIRRNDLDADLLLQLMACTAELTGHRDAGIRNSALDVLGHLQASVYLDQIRDALRHEDLSTRVTAIRALAGMGDVASASELMDIAQHGQPEERVAAVEVMGQLGIHEAMPLLKSLADGIAPSLREAAIIALGGIDSPEAAALLKEMLKYAVTRKPAAKALYGGVKPRKSVLSEVDRKLAEKRRRKSQPIAFISLDAAIRYALVELRPYEERELTERIACVCEDYCSTRRSLIDRKLMTRSDSIYTFTAFGETVWRVEHSIMDRVPVAIGENK